MRIFDETRVPTNFSELWLAVGRAKLPEEKLRIAMEGKAFIVSSGLLLSILELLAEKNRLPLVQACKEAISFDEILNDHLLRCA